MSYSLDLDNFEDYQPEPPLDIDPRPIAPGQLRQWRESSFDHERQVDLADDLGFSVPAISKWENHGTDHGPLCAIIRQLFAGEPVPKVGPTPYWVAKSVAALVGGWGPMADALRVPRTRLQHTWRIDRIPTKRRESDLVLWLFEEFDAERVDELPPNRGSDSVLTDEDLKDIHRRRRDGETFASIAEDYPISMDGIWWMYREHVEPVCDEEVRP